MTAKQANQIAAGIIARIPTVNGEWVETEKARAVVRQYSGRLFANVKWALNRAAHECEGKNQDQIRAICVGAIDAVMTREIAKLEAEAIRRT
jgi:hypothetical protein